MRRTFLRLSAVVFVVAMVATAQAQDPQRGSRLVRGRVVSADAGQPLPNARIAVIGTAIAARADLNGRFTITAPPGATLLVTKAGFVRRQESLADDRGGTQLDLRLTRAAAITGRISDEYGDPVVGASVSVEPADKSIQLPPGTRFVTSDDRGDYRIGGLLPGSYRVATRTLGSTTVREVERRAALQSQLRELSQRPPTSAPDDASRREAALALSREYALLSSPTTYMTYFPGTSEAADATVIDLAPGDERQAIDLHLTGQTARQALSVLPSLVTFQDPSIPPGTASVRGTVVSSTGRVLSHAVVLIVSDTGLNFLTTTADEDGRYAFDSVPPGQYRVAASKPGFSLASDGFAFQQIGANGVSVTVRADERRDKADLTLLPWGNVTGHVYDESGEPVSGALVGLLLSRYENGRRRLVPASRVPGRYTDDRGEFRLFGVPDGEYVLGASVIDTPANSMGGYAPTFYPGTNSGAEVQFIPVAAGDEVKGLDFSLVVTPTVQVSGTLLDPQGKPTTGGRFTLLSRSSLAARIDAVITADGHFEFHNVPPGQYVIQADRGRRGGGIEGEFVAYPLTVGRSDISGLTVQTSAGTVIDGHVTYDSVTDARPARLSLSISPVPIDYDLAPPGIAVTEPGIDGAFQLTGISGLRRLQATHLPDGWMVRSILSNGIDVTDQPLEFGRPGQATQSFDVVLTDQVNVVSGTVGDERARRVGGIRVVIFSANRSHWYPGSRFVRSTETAADGTFSIAGLPAGSYFVAPALRVPAGEEAWRDPALLDSLRASATSMSLGEGDRQAVTLRVSSR